MKTRSSNKLFYIKATLGLLLTVGMAFTFVSVDPVETTTAVGGGYCQGSSPSTDTTATTLAAVTYNGVTTNNGATVHNGGQPGYNSSSITTQYLSDAFIEMSGTATPGQAKGSVRATVTVDGNVVFDETETNVTEAGFTFELTGMTSPAVITVTSTACANVSTATTYIFIMPQNEFTFTCGVDETVGPDELAYFPVIATNIASIYQYSVINVTMKSNPDGPAMTLETLPLTFQNEHTNLAVIPTTGLTPNQPYTLTFTAESNNPGLLVTQTCEAQLTVETVGPPTAEISCNSSPTDCTIAYGAAATISWVSTNTTQCTVSPKGWTGTSSTGQSTGALTATTKYTADCDAVNGTTISGDVTVNVLPEPDFSITCIDKVVPVAQGGTTSFSIGTAAIADFSEEVTFSAIIDPKAPKPVEITFIPESQVPSKNDTSYAEALVVAPDNATIGDYIITFSATGGGKTHSVDCELNVTGVVPEPPINVVVENQTCDILDVIWEPSPDIKDNKPDGFRVYRRADPNKDWEPLGIVEYGGPSRLSYTLPDLDPLSLTSNYYAVTAYNEAGESSPPTEPDETPKAVRLCFADLGNSDKDLINVVGMINKNFDDPEVIKPCSNNSEPALLDNNGVFSPGDIVTFRITICNFGEATATGISLKDILTNLHSPDIIDRDPNSCVIGNPVDDGNGTIDFILDDIDVDKACEIIIEAEIDDISDATKRFGVFQNTVELTSDNQNLKFSTPPYLFRDSGREPQRIEQ